MKDLSIEEIICRIDEDNPICAKNGDVFRRLATDDMTIVGFMKIIELDSKKELGIQLPSEDIIHIPARDHPYIQTDENAYPLFVEKTIRVWNPELVEGAFYVLFKNDTDGQLILISKINADTIEYDIITSRLNGNVNMFYPETVRVILTMTDAQNLKFSPLTDIK